MWIDVTWGKVRRSVAPDEWIPVLLLVGAVAVAAHLLWAYRRRGPSG